MLNPNRRAGMDSKRRRMSPRATWTSPRICSGDTPDGKASAYNSLTASLSPVSYTHLRAHETSAHL
eukprot:11194754-Alexandrium_andersonii.AAC.1